MKIELRADLSSSYYILITNYDFRNGRFYDGTSSSATTTSSTYQNYQVELSTLSNSSPSTYEWVDINLQTRYNGSTYSSSNFAGTIDFTVEEYRNGRWESASSSDYYLERNSLSLYNADNGNRRLERFAYFKDIGEFRIIAKINGTEYSGYQTFYVNRRGNADNTYSYNDNSYNTSLTISDVSTNSPARNQRVDVELRLNNSYYTKNRVNFSVEEYRNGSWRSAYTSDYTLDSSSYTFSSSETRIKLSSLISFHTNGEFRLIANLKNGNSAYQNFNINTSSTQNNWNSSNIAVPSNFNYTPAEFKKLQAVYGIWNGIIDSLKKDYPKLRNN